MFYTFTLDYVEEIFQTYLKASKGDLRDAVQKLKEKSPAPMNEMLQKERGEEQDDSERCSPNHTR